MEEDGVGLRAELGEDPLSSTFQDEELSDDKVVEDNNKDMNSTASPLANSRDVLHREVVSSLHKGSMNRNQIIRTAATDSLVAIASESPLLVLQTWLDQFARTNGGSSPTEYAAPDRVHLLNCLEVLIGSALLEGADPTQRACLGRIIAMATEEMTRQPDVLHEVQKPCSEILIKLGEKHVEYVMEAILAKFQPGVQPHYYVVVTLSRLAHVNAIGTVPFLKGILGTLISNLKGAKRDTMRLAMADSLSRFSEALVDYLANIEASPDPSVTKEHFSREFDNAHDVLFSSWLSKSDLKLKHGVLEAMGNMSGLLSTDRITRNTTGIITVLIANYKKTNEPFYVTQSIAQLIDAVVSRDPLILEQVIEPLLTALFVQVCHNAANPSDYSKPLAMKNQFETLRCYDVLVRSHNENLVAGLIVRMGSVDENIRLAALTVFKHIMTSSLEQFQDRMPEVFKALHGKLNDPSNKVRRMLAQITAQLGRMGYLTGPEGTDFIDFIVRLCALPSSDSGTLAESSNGDVVTNNSLKQMCDSILQLLANNETSMEPILWPRLIDYLLAPGFTGTHTRAY